MEQVVSLSATISINDSTKMIWDVVVIGSGVAGAIAAREAALAGYRVLLIDKRSFPRRKVCGACLNGVAISVLDQLGLSEKIEELGGPELRSFSLHCGSKSTSLRLPGGRAISREKLDVTLICAAIESGTDFLPETSAEIGDENPTSRVIRLDRSGIEACINARTIVVASGLEGLRSRPSKDWVTRIGKSSRLGVGCIIADDDNAYESGTIWMAVGAGGYAGLVRVEDGRLNVAAAYDREFLRRYGSPAAATQKLLEKCFFPIPKQLMAAEWQGTLPMTRQTRPVASHRVFLVGDAAGYIEPFTGEGMAWALLTGQHVTTWVLRALQQHDWSPEIANGWVIEHRRLVQNRQRFCCVSTHLLRSPILLTMGLSVLASWPWLGRKLIDIINAPTTHGRLAHECRS